MNVLSIQSHVAYGHVGNSSAVFPMQRLGVEVWPIHTVQFSNHTGYGSWKGRVVDGPAIEELVDGIADRGVLQSCDGLLSGYMGSADIGNAILSTLKRVRALNPAALYCCDPVIGDVGRGVFVRPGVPEFMRDQAVPASDIITPNQFELEYLSGIKTDSLAGVKDAIAAVHQLGPRVVLVTSIETRDMPADALDLIAGEGGRFWRVRTPRLSLSVNGAGDAIAALFLVHYARSGSAKTALIEASASIFGLLQRTAEAGSREILMVAAQDEFVSPPIAFPLRRSEIMSRRFATLDVFTADRLTGNPLAVVLDARGLDTDDMQAIAGEFNLSETVFVFPPEDPRHRADIRIFTPKRELPFAGHPTVGTAVLLALLDQAGKPGAVAFGLKEVVGVVSCAVEIVNESGGSARFRLPKLPETWAPGRESTECAWALSLDPTDIGFDRHVPSRHSAGVPYDLVPVASIDALARATPGGEAFEKAFGDSGHPAAYAYTRREGGVGFRARMFGLGMGIVEDPATGSAAAAFAGALMQCEPLGDGEHDIVIEQGFEMGRPSIINLQMVIRNGALVSAEIGGNAVMVSRGELL